MNKYYIKKISMENIGDFYKLFDGEKCESCQCTYFLRAHEDLDWDSVGIAEAKEFRRKICDLYSDGYIYYHDNNPIAWCQCIDPELSPYMKNLLKINDDVKNIKIITCFYVIAEYRGNGIIKDLTKLVIDECKLANIQTLYSIPVYDKYLEKVSDNYKNEKLHTGYKNLFEKFDFECIGDNERFYFMKKDLI